MYLPREFWKINLGDENWDVYFHFYASQKQEIMSFDRFLLAVESRDLSQAEKFFMRVSSFPKMSDGQQNFFLCLSTTKA